MAQLLAMFWDVEIVTHLFFITIDLAISMLKEHPLIYSHRRFQYTSDGFKRRNDKTDMINSMSRVGRGIDNGPMELFWGTLKYEKYYLRSMRHLKSSLK